MSEPSVAQTRPAVGPAVMIVNAMVEQGYVPEDHALGHIAVFAITALEAGGYSVVPTSQAERSEVPRSSPE